MYTMLVCMSVAVTLTYLLAYIEWTSTFTDCSSANIYIQHQRCAGI